MNIFLRYLLFAFVITAATPVMAMEQHVQENYDEPVQAAMHYLDRLQEIAQDTTLSFRNQHNQVDFHIQKALYLDINVQCVLLMNINLVLQNSNINVELPYNKALRQLFDILHHHVYQVWLSNLVPGNGLTFNDMIDLWHDAPMEEFV